LSRISKKVGDWPLWGILVSFLTWEIFSHETGNKDQHTLSNRVQAAEAKYHFIKVPVGLFMLYLTGHLVFSWPL